MSNMSYCRFQNTVGDLAECESALREIMNLDELSEDEQRAARQLIRICSRIADDWGDDA